MIRLFLILSAIFILFSCGNKKKVVTIHPDGYYKEVYHVKDDSIRHGPYIKYFAEGQIADSCGYTDNKIHGTRKIYTTEGKLEIEETYEMGVFHGPYKTYYPNGQIKKNQEYLNNKIQGEVRQFYPNGQLKAIVQFEDNLENGPFKEYYENGNLHWEGSYLGGEYEQDSLKEYNDRGEMIRILLCEKGICQTIWTPEEGKIEVKKIFKSQ